MCHRPERAWRLGRAAGALLALGAMLGVATAGGVPAASAAARPTLTVHAHYVARDHNIGFGGIALPGGASMLVELEFRLEEKTGARWQPITSWMALITGVGARWSVNGRYSSQLMAMNEPVPRGQLRVEMHVVDSEGGQAIAYSNAVRVR